MGVELGRAITVRAVEECENLLAVPTYNAKVEIPPSHPARLEAGGIPREFSLDKRNEKRYEHSRRFYDGEERVNPGVQYRPRLQHGGGAARRHAVPLQQTE